MLASSFVLDKIVSPVITYGRNGLADKWRLHILVRTKVESEASFDKCDEECRPSFLSEAILKALAPLHERHRNG